ncbi:MAG: MBL fold metallo-hydrolase, partial [Chloroflexi bacterium]|nr:MBL fold metallo-hydrolase [Chloroflexota bacterium]
MNFSFHRVPLGIDNCFLLRGEHTIFIDGGAPGGLNSFVKHMQQLNVDPQQIELIILTHGHIDHFGGADRIRQRSGAEVFQLVIGGGFNGRIIRVDSGLRRRAQGVRHHQKIKGI